MRLTVELFAVALFRSRTVFVILFIMVAQGAIFAMALFRQQP